MIEINFTVEGVPVPKGRPRFTRTGRVYTPKKTIDAERRFRENATQYVPISKIGGEIELSVSFHMPIPKSCNPSKAIQLISKGHTKKPDLDNLLKLVMDSMDEFWYDDRQVVKVLARKSYSTYPRTEVRLSEVIQ